MSDTKKVISDITNSFLGHDDMFPRGECPCFTRENPDHCTAWQTHIDQQIDFMRGK